MFLLRMVIVRVFGVLLLLFSYTAPCTVRVIHKQVQNMYFETNLYDVTNNQLLELFGTVANS
jgi:hypothetical protein